MVNIPICPRTAYFAEMTSIYRGSLKHKNRPSTGRKGTLCPEWTHNTAESFAGEPFQHDWSSTASHRLFEEANVWSDGRRFATEQGMAFEAKPSADGTWHGFPIPWESVPPQLLRQWLLDGKVSRRQVKLYNKFDKDNIHWALDSEKL